MDKVGYRVTLSDGSMYWTMRDFMPPEEVRAGVERCIAKPFSDVRPGDTGYFKVLSKDKYVALETPRPLWTIGEGGVLQTRQQVIDVYRLEEGSSVHLVKPISVKVLSTDTFIIPQEK